jgi:hypothetical protein
MLWLIAGLAQASGVFGGNPPQAQVRLVSSSTDLVLVEAEVSSLVLLIADCEEGEPFTHPVSGVVDALAGGPVTLPSGEWCSVVVSAGLAEVAATWQGDPVSHAGSVGWFEDHPHLSWHVTPVE